MNDNDKAFCGDGLLRCILGELYMPCGMSRNSINQFQSNFTYAEVWRSINGFNMEGHSNHTLGTMYEAKVYEVFAHGGYESAMEYVKESHGRWVAKQSHKVRKKLFPKEKLKPKS